MESFTMFLGDCEIEVVVFGRDHYEIHRNGKRRKLLEKWIDRSPKVESEIGDFLVDRGA